MLISFKKKFIFFKNIKAASTSLFTFFSQFCVPYKIKKSNQFKTPEFSLMGNYNTGIVGYEKKRSCEAEKIIKITNNINKNIWKEYFKFTSIRNPWDKMVSCYFYFKNEKRKEEKTKNFIDFIEWRYEKYLNEGSMISYTIKKEFICDYHIRYENFKNDLKHVFNILNINLSKFEYFPEINKNIQYKKEKKDYRKFYNNYTRDLVEKIYKNKIDYFKYEF